MKKTQITEVQIAFALRQTEMGVSIKEVCCRKLSVPDIVDLDAEPAHIVSMHGADDSSNPT